MASGKAGKVYLRLIKLKERNSSSIQFCKFAECFTEEKLY